MTIAASKRLAERATWATSLDEVIERGKLVQQGWVNRYRRVARIVAEARLGEPLPLHVAIPVLPRPRQHSRQQSLDGEARAVVEVHET